MGARSQETMIDFGAVIALLGPKAVGYQLDEHERLDKTALAAASDRPGEKRAEAVRRWLREY